MIHKRSYMNGIPRPQFSRTSFEILDGKWEFYLDYDNLGESRQFPQGFTSDLTINVPFVYTTKLSGVNLDKRCDYVWYARKLTIKDLTQDERVILHFEGSDYHTKVWINGDLVGEDCGGYHRISFDITDFVKPGDNLLVVKVTDDFSTEKPRGKQRWKPYNYECFYVETTGIYKTVWLEYVNQYRLETVKMTPSRREENILIEGTTSTKEKVVLGITITFEDKLVKQEVLEVSDGKFIVTLPLTEQEPLYLWDVGDGKLYDVEFTLIRDGKEVDKVYSYFGVRDIEIHDAKIYLNGKELYQKLILDQGYWPDSHLTPPSTEALLLDITKVMEMGFNGARKHQKVEDERYIYFADCLGFLVWLEMPSMYTYSEQAKQAFTREWELIIKQYYNHPSIITYTPFNESWGISEIKTNKDQQQFVNDIYYLTKAYDHTRLVITNDGWEHTISDILTIHHYEQDGDKLHSYFKTIDKATAPIYEAHPKGAFADGYQYNNQPIIISEFGGTAFVNSTVNGAWGYGVGVRDEQEFINRFRKLIEAIRTLDYVCGYCYTQLSDVQQEVNGLFYENREEKIASEIINKILNE